MVRSLFFHYITEAILCQCKNAIDDFELLAASCLKALFYANFIIGVFLIDYFKHPKPLRCFCAKSYIVHKLKMLRFPIKLKYSMIGIYPCSLIICNSFLPSFIGSISIDLCGFVSQQASYLLSNASRTRRMNRTSCGE